MKYRDFIAILEFHKFELDRHGATSHRQYVGIIDGVRKIVTVSGRDGDDIRRENLSSMMRQSGLPKKIFRQR
ncbi:MAG: type II toxin-antitoxin system HicA family toxin [Stellaceae bacterium]